jgi:C1A family cysteine protease
MQQRKYGWKRQLPDFRDLKLTRPEALPPLPASVDLRPYCPPVYDQGSLGSCTANALCGADEIDQIRQGSNHVFGPSRLFVYYFERFLEGTVSTDSGAQIRDGVKVLNRFGVCHESLWPYDVSQFAVQPPATAITAAVPNRVSKYQSIDNSNIDNLKYALSQKYPVVFGFTVYESFESDQVAQTGLVPMPTAGEQVMGGHAVVAVGYNTSTGRITVRNSWGSTWGDHGYCYFPEAYLSNLDLASDFWAIDFVPLSLN